MTLATTALLLFLALFLALGVWVGFALIASGYLVLELFRDMPVQRLLAQDFWGTMTSTELVALPLFILMGEILFHTRLAQNLFDGLTPLVKRLPGRLIHVNILACTIFAAASGSSSATTATVGRITYQELTKRGYDRDLVMGSLSGAGTLGLMIPPSIILIIYGVLTDVSILQLFIAGVIPGLILSGAFMGYLMVMALARPGLIPSGADGDITAKASAVLKLLPTVLLVALIIGSLYTGIAAPSEAAVVGVAGALIIAFVDRSLTPAITYRALIATVRTCAMLGLITAGALFLAKGIAFLGIPRQIAEAIDALGLGPIGLIVVLTIFYMILGCFLEGISMVVMTLPITFPIAIAAGWDPVWFGIFLVVVVEMSQITPPVGFNLFVVQQLTGESLGRIAKASFPFFLIMAAFVALITAYPEIVTYFAKPVRAG